MTTWLLIVALILLAADSVLGHILHRRHQSQLAELREQYEPFSEIIAAAINVYESRLLKHDLEAELAADRELITKVKQLLKPKPPNT